MAGSGSASIRSRLMYCGRKNSQDGLKRVAPGEEDCRRDVQTHVHREGVKMSECWILPRSGGCALSIVSPRFCPGGQSEVMDRHEKRGRMEGLL